VLPQEKSERRGTRSIYGFELKGDRIDRLAERFESVSKKFLEEIGKFLGYLQERL